MARSVYFGSAVGCRSCPTLGNKQRGLVKGHVKLVTAAMAICLAHETEAVVPYRPPEPEVFSCLTFPVRGSHLDQASESALRNTLKYIQVVESNVLDLAVTVAIPTYLPTPDGLVPPRRESIGTAVSRLQTLQTRLARELLVIAPSHFSSEIASAGDSDSRTYRCDAWIRVTFQRRPTTCADSSACSIRCNAEGCTEK